MFKKLFFAADAYVAQCNWRDLALVKFCLAAIGLMAGLFVPQKAKKPVFLGALIVFVATYLPLMAKFVRIAHDALRQAEVE